MSSVERRPALDAQRAGGDRLAGRPAGWPLVAHAASTCGIEFSDDINYRPLGGHLFARTLRSGGGGGGHFCSQPERFNPP